ncbi:hypothetical protein HPL003_06665 [Paenibacillus terrae HPL-003]|uniref:Uncharacterized protein n=1 Tax=Paenibacillus terrae (strain HPL-003) TaxID=985665 RepID=G7W3K9_PAETH|nr:hypothetical protein HPL003_06665 [Paenibacillus terrae HPL-003]
MYLRRTFQNLEDKLSGVRRKLQGVNMNDLTARAKYYLLSWED